MNCGYRNAYGRNWRKSSGSGKAQRGCADIDPGWRLGGYAFCASYRVTDPHAFLFHHAGAAYLNVIQAGEAAIREIFGALTLEDTLNPDHSRLSSRLIRKTQ